MKKRKLISMVLAATLALTSLTGCGKKNSSSDDSVLRVGMECAYAPFNWSQERMSLQMVKRQFQSTEQTCMHMDMT